MMGDLGPAAKTVVLDCRHPPQALRRHLGAVGLLPCLLLADGPGPHHDRDADQVRLYLAWLRDAHRWLQVQETRTLYHMALEADYFCDAGAPGRWSSTSRRNGLPSGFGPCCGDLGNLDFDGTVVGYDPFVHAARTPHTVHGCCVRSTGRGYETTLHRGSGDQWYADGTAEHPTVVVTDDLLAVAGLSPRPSVQVNDVHLVSLFAA